VPRNDRFRGVNDPDAEPNSASWCDSLLAALGRDTAAAPHALTITGQDPVLPTRFRVGEAAAAALAAQAIAAADLWCVRGGRPQHIAVDVRAAAASLLSFFLLRLPVVPFPRQVPTSVALYKARDGRWIHLHGGFPHLHQRTLSFLGCADDAAAIAHAVSAWDALALEDGLAARGLCGACLRGATEWAVHPQGVALAATPLVEMERIGTAPAEPLRGPGSAAAGARPLTGVRVLDLTRVLAGPTCARTLAEHGAEVLHVRSPRLPFIEPFVIDTNPGKRSCHLDLDRPADAQRLRALVRGADVFSQGYRAGTLARRGFGPEELVRLRPGIVVVSINCYGHDGPWAGRPGWEQLAQTATGMAFEHAGADEPGVVPAAVTDYTTGHLAALGVLRALARRAAEGGSWHVRVSLARTAMWILSLPRTDPGVPASGIDPAALSPWWVDMDTAWGRLARLGPIARMSETPTRWDLPPVPLGTHAAQWK
jgi:crotonobetainyl-CoA:carnitine CoA-transferase CaiB-like acyl-CoA transferase